METNGFTADVMPGGRVLLRVDAGPRRPYRHEYVGTVMRDGLRFRADFAAGPYVPGTGSVQPVPEAFRTQSAAVAALVASYAARFDVAPFVSEIMPQYWRMAG